MHQKWLHIGMDWSKAPGVTRSRSLPHGKPDAYKFRWLQRSSASEVNGMSSMCVFAQPQVGSCIDRMHLYLSGAKFLKNMYLVWLMHVMGDSGMRGKC